MAQIVPAEHKLPDEECRQLVENFADILLNDERMRTVFLAALENPGISKSLAEKQGFPTDLYGSNEAQEIVTALNERDRPKLVFSLGGLMREDRPTEEMAKTLLQLPEILPAAFRAGLKEAQKMFPAKPGRKPKVTRRDYPKIAIWGDRLVPLCEKVLNELQSNTKHTMREVLEYLATDFPEESAFLLRNIQRFELALKDDGLAKRAIRPKSRARALADAMAGTDYELELRTSLERAREGRRMLTKRLC